MQLYLLRYWNDAYPLSIQLDKPVVTLQLPAPVFTAFAQEHADSIVDKVDTPVVNFLTDVTDRLSAYGRDQGVCLHHAIGFWQPSCMTQTMFVECDEPPLFRDPACLVPVFCGTRDGHRDV